MKRRSYIPKIIKILPAVLILSAIINTKGVAQQQVKEYIDSEVFMLIEENKGILDPALIQHLLTDQIMSIEEIDLLIRDFHDGQEPFENSNLIMDLNTYEEDDKYDHRFFEGGFNGQIRTSVVFNDELYIGGDFTWYNGKTQLYRFAKWSGSKWESADSEFSGPVYTLLEFEGNLVAGGSFIRNGNQIMRNIAVWNGLEWQSIGEGFNSLVFSLEIYNNNLIAGGFFTQSGTTTVNRIASWDGNQWSSLGSGFNSRVEALEVNNGQLIAGGDFTETADGTTTVNRIASWDGSQWSALGEGFNSIVLTLHVFNEELYAGGFFTQSGTTTVNRIARWDGNQWISISDIPIDVQSQVNTVVDFNEKLIIGGDFLNIEGNYKNIIQIDEGQTLALESVSYEHGLGFNNQVYSSIIFEGDLYVGGRFTAAGSKPINYIARWDGSEWQPAGEGFNSWVFSLKVYDNQLIAGGFFTQSGTTTVNRIASWDGNQWSNLGSGFNQVVYALEVNNGQLIAGGNFTETADGTTTVNRIASWDGSQWSALGEGFNSRVVSLEIYNNNLIAGGWFTLSGSTSLSYIAKWDGSQWSSLGSGFNNRVEALEVNNGQLIVGGWFTGTADGTTTVNYIASWNGSQWSNIGEPFNFFVFSLARFQGDLIAAGMFTQIGTTAVNRIARWDGNQWQGIGSGTNDTISTLYGGVNDLFIGGNFKTAGGKAASHFTTYSSENFPPEAPENLIAAAMENAAPLLNWNPSMNVAIDSYQIYSGNNSRNLSLLDTVDPETTSYQTDNDETTFFSVKAFSSRGLESSFSNLSSYVNDTLMVKNDWRLLSSAVSEDTEIDGPVSLFGFEGAYTRADELSSSSGYWIKSNEETSIAFRGSGIVESLIDLNEGWNLIGGMADSVEASAIKDPAGILAGTPLYSYDSSEKIYIEAEGLSPYSGYWIFAQNEGQIELSLTPSNASADKLWQYDVPVEQQPLNQITFRSGNKEQSIFYSAMPIPEREKLTYLLPPKAPAPALDIRTADGFRLSDHKTVELNLTSTSYPIEVELIKNERNANHNYRLIANNGQNSEFIDLQPGQTRLIQKEYDQLYLVKISAEEVVMKTELGKNYPNPFNPTTTIRYQISTSAPVSLQVYDIIGRSVATLVNEVQQPGTYTIQFDASGLSSGVYFLRMQTNDFSGIQKLTLIK